jgi:probable addiction module antidote protein
VAEKLTTFDIAEYLTSEEAIEVFLSEAIATNDAGYLAHTQAIVARARKINERKAPLPHSLSRRTRAARSHKH